MGQFSSSANSSDDKNDDLLSEDLYQEKISWMKFKVPSKTNKSAISECMNITMKNRRKWILENLPTIDEIFDQFSRLADYSGQMIDEEFDRLYSGASDNFLTKFSTYYVPRILTYCNTVRQDLYRVSNFIEEENLRAILLLAHLLPVSNSLRKGKGKKKGVTSKKSSNKENMRKEDYDDVYSTTFPNSSLIQIWPEGCSMENKIKEMKKEAQGPIQPYIILIKGKSLTYFVQTDNVTLTPSINSPIIALDLLFKVHYVLNVTYPTTLLNFFSFLEHYCFKFSSEKAHAFVSSTHINICNTTPISNVIDNTSDT
ncbi:uncharacterized protein [Linepithema humile]|uniref:uncharacterized protein isoform X1 n=1 Tax=Linepithema humile TaxID=83485 RepID=UPI000623B654|nr:PREDICTED: uncharacterized protein LOC105673639 isoform X2 [Linepithema humile]XP_012224839.1 PREDICTED: uncharacterized protein LOC105673639 isoform X2 [Linepithema humile]XP_012224840.1 PREDICTED: uncharacterized protein LOC105673639 isoform X2 [Linepithema humile]